MPEHRIVEFEEDFLEDGSMVAVCSCGWKSERKLGRMEAEMAHRDHKYADLLKNWSRKEPQIETPAA